MTQGLAKTLKHDTYSKICNQERMINCTMSKLYIVICQKEKGKESSVKIIRERREKAKAKEMCLTSYIQGWSGFSNI